jgi:hypothetical protein
MKQRMSALYASYAEPLVRFVRREVKEASPSPEAASSAALLRLWAALLLPLLGAARRIRLLLRSLGMLSCSSPFT